MSDNAEDFEALKNAIQNGNRERVVTIFGMYARRIADAVRVQDYAGLCSYARNLDELQIAARQVIIAVKDTGNENLTSFALEDVGLEEGLRMMCVECIHTIVPPADMELARKYIDVLGRIHFSHGITLSALHLHQFEDKSISDTRRIAAELSRCQFIDIIRDRSQRNPRLALTPLGEDAYNQIEKNNATQ